MTDQISRRDSMDGELIKLAASFARGDCLPSYWPGDLPKTTPKSVIQDLLVLHHKARLWACLLRDAADEIRRLKSCD